MASLLAATCGANASLTWTKTELVTNQSSTELLARSGILQLTSRRFPSGSPKHFSLATHACRMLCEITCCTTWRHSMKLQLNITFDHRKCSTQTFATLRHCSLFLKRTRLELKHRIDESQTLGFQTVFIWPGSALTNRHMSATSWNIEKNIWSPCSSTSIQLTWWSIPKCWERSCKRCNRFEFTLTSSVISIGNLKIGLKST